MAVYVTVPFFKIRLVQFFPKIIEFFGTIGINIFFFRENAGVDKDETDIFSEKFKIPYRMRRIADIDVHFTDAGVENFGIASVTG